VRRIEKEIIRHNGLGAPLRNSQHSPEIEHFDAGSFGEPGGVVFWAFQKESNEANVESDPCPKGGPACSVHLCPLRAAARGGDELGHTLWVERGRQDGSR
jgi:hypothetical protein